MLGILRPDEFWAILIGLIAVFSLIAVIVVDQYRHPEIYSKKSTKEKK
jgi:hypothetical protein